MTPHTSDLETTLKQAWTLLMQNLIVVVPGLILNFVLIVVIIIMVLAAIGIGLAIGVTSQIAGNGIATHGYNSLIAVGIVFCAIVFVVGLLGAIIMAVVQVTFLTGMVGALWEHGTTTFADGWKAFRERGFEVFCALLLLLVIGIAAIILAPFTLLLSLPAYGVLFLYVPASIIIGKRNTPDAIAESFRLAVQDFVPTLIIVGISIGVSIVAMVAGAVSTHTIFFAGGILAMLFPIAGNAYVSLVIVGHYRKLR